MGTCHRCVCAVCAVVIFSFQILFPDPGCAASPNNIFSFFVDDLKFHAGEASFNYDTCMRLAKRLTDNSPPTSEKESITKELNRTAALLRHHASECLAVLDQIDTALITSGADPVLSDRVKRLRRRLSGRVDRFVEECLHGNFNGSFFSRRHGTDLKTRNDTNDFTPPERIAPVAPPAESQNDDYGIDVHHSMNTLSGITTNDSFIPPTQNDLQEDGTDVVFSDSIQALAKSLDYDPIRIYEYVRDHIMYQPYWGSLKGARGALAEGCGNDADIASLLIALLRVSGYPARYGEALVTVDIERAKNWLGLQEDKMVGYYLATAGIPDVQDLYRGASLVQVRFRHIFVEVYMPYGDYRGQQRSTLHKLWVPLAPAFKTMRHIEGRLSQNPPAFDPDVFIQRLRASATVQPDGALSGLDQNVVSSILDEYRDALDELIDRENPQMALRELYGYSEIERRHDPILPITLPFESGPLQRYSKLPELIHHRIKIQLSYWGTDLDADEEEGGLGTQEIRYMTPTANVIGKRLTLSYRPATRADEELLRRYDGNLFGTPCFLIHMYPQLTLDGVVVAENEHKEREGAIDNAAISLGLDENIRIELYKPGETVFPQRRSDTLVTVGDYMAIVLDFGKIARSYLDASAQRLEKAVADPTSDVEKLIGEQLFQTGCAYFYQFDAAADVMAQQAGVRWFRNPSELTVSRHLQVSWLMDFFPVAIESSTVLLDVTGNRIQAIPPTAEWPRREAFLRTAGQYLSLLEHTILTELYHQDAVSAVSLIQTSLDRQIPIYEITPQNKSSVLPKIDLPREDIEIIERELRLGQIVLVPKSRLTVGTYTGAPIVSLTPPGNPMGAFREGYFITRCKPNPYPLNPANGGQITEVISDILNDLVAPDYRGWLSFQKTTQGALNAVMTNSDAIRDGTMPVRTFLNSAAGMALSLIMMQQRALASDMLVTACAMMSMWMKSLNEFLHSVIVMYIDFEGDSLYFPEQNQGVRSAKYVVMCKIK